eukprot:1572649-Pyramimonas_sp.AAC.1
MSALPPPPSCAPRLRSPPAPSLRSPLPRLLLSPPLPAPSRPAGTPDSSWPARLPAVGGGRPGKLIVVVVWVRGEGARRNPER